MPPIRAALSSAEEPVLKDVPANCDIGVDWLVVVGVANANDVVVTFDVVDDANGGRDSGASLVVVLVHVRAMHVQLAFDLVEQSC
jgi:hypothetical protein